MKGTTSIKATAVFTAALMTFGGLAATANAAEQPEQPQAPASGLTIQAPEGQTIKGKSFVLYKIGDYGDVQKNDKGQVTGIDVTSVNGLDQAIQDANQKAGVTDSKDLDAAGDLMRATKADQLNKAAGALAETAKTGGLGKGVTVTADSDSYAIPATVLGDGYWLLVSDGTLPVLVGTTAGGASFAGGQTLGRAVIKGGSVGTPVKTMVADGVTSETEGEHVSATVGVSQTFTIKFTVPSSLSYTGFTLRDDMTGMTPDTGFAPTLTLNDKTDATKDVKITPDGTGITVTGDLNMLKKYENRQVTLTYKARLAQGSSTDQVKNTAKLSIIKADGTTDQSKPDGTDEVPVRSYGFRLVKESMNRDRAVTGAGFKVRSTSGDKSQYLSWDAKAGAWTLARDEKSATEITTGKDGLAAFDGLASGTYVVDETTVPDGYVKTVKASLKVTIDDNGAVTVAPLGGYQNLVDAQLDKQGRIVVRNIDSLTQLPQTGAIGVGVTVMLGMALLGAGFGGYAVRAKRKGMPTA